MVEAVELARQCEAAGCNCPGEIWRPVMTMFYGKRRLTTEQVRDVIRRAELLDRQDLETISEDDIRTIAGDLGISEEALQRAMATVPIVAEPTPGHRQPATTAVIAWFGGATAAMGLSKLAGPLPQPYLAYTALSTLIALTCVSASLGFKARSALAQRRFQLGNLALWSGFGFVTGTFGHYELAVPGFVLGAAAAIIGFVANRVVGPPMSTDHGAGPSGATDTDSGAGWRSILARLLHRGEFALWDYLPVRLTRSPR